MSALKVFRDNFMLVLKLGAGFFADAYDLFVIDIVLSILQQENKTDPEGLGYSTASSSFIASATSIGAVVGMLVFGLIGDYIGRKRGVMITGTFVAIGSILSACCFRCDAFPLMSQLTICRTFLGIGIGGEYPLSATMASERTDARVRGRVIAGVFSMQGVGMLFSSLLAYIFVKAGVSLEVTWRFLLAFGAVPAMIALVLRTRMTESVAFIAAQSEKLSASKKASRTWATMKKYAVPLAGTMLAWFLLDVTFYGTGEFKHSVANSLFPPSNAQNSADIVAENALFGLIISLMAIPGYLCSCAFIDKMGRWNLQVFGFSMMIVFYLLMAIAVSLNWNGTLNLIIFGLTFFFTNFGPNATTFIIPTEIFPTSARATCHGLSAAAGKIGAVVGAAGFPPAERGVGLSGVMYICTAVAVCGLLATLGLLNKSFVDRASLAESNTVVEPPSSFSLRSGKNTVTKVGTISSITSSGGDDDADEPYSEIERGTSAVMQTPLESAAEGVAASAV